ncbi:hypothetical protein RhiirA4_466778 [Rhizophagus irregularis]|uniref:Uncharacterized protein n=1 Tax=Rhizophagus irregularis TaxID=588596 RepID=A0A2I1GUQ3_9GLOM|nr:hypothetical protein RhiirA4_466778 [Rhizophagus irregularis]
MSQNIPSISISDLSKYYQFNCEKLVQQIVSKEQKSTYENKKDTITENLTLLEASKKRGDKFELEVKNKLNNVVDYTIKLKSFIPDFIEVIEEDGKTKLMVLDAKSSKSTRISHQFQAASYVYLLKFIIKEFPALTISRTIGICLPSLPLQTFNIDLLLQRIGKFFHQDLPRIITESPFWHYNSRCRTCSTSIIPYLSLKKAKHLTKSMPSQVEFDIEDLVKAVNSLNIGAKDRSMIKQIIKYDKKSKSSIFESQSN